MRDEAAPSFLGDLQSGSVCLNGNGNSFLSLVVQPFCEDDHICALACTVFETTVFKDSAGFILF